MENIKNMTPQEIVNELDKYIIGQKEAKRNVAIALRNRWRRLNVNDEIKNEIIPNNILMIGATGVGKTEIAMRAAFISAFSDKQTIILSPSTVLTEQHYSSFIQRYKNFPVTIEKLSRNTGLKNKQSLYQDFNVRKIDIS